MADSEISEHNFFVQQTCSPSESNTTAYDQIQTSQKRNALRFKARETEEFLPSLPKMKCPVQETYAESWELKQDQPRQETVPGRQDYFFINFGMPH